MTTTHRLANGFTILTDHLPHVDTVTAGVWTGVGARNETPEINGVSHFLEHMAFKGTDTRSVADIALSIESAGGHMNAYTGSDTTAYFVQMMAEDRGLGTEILADILLNSTFPEEELERERGVILQEIDRYADEPESVCHEAASTVYWPGQALGRPILGPSEIIRTMPRETIAAYIHDNYRAERMVLAVSGNIDAAAVVAQAEALFGGVAAGSDLFREPAVFGGGERRIERDSEQVHFMMGFGAVSIHDPDYPAQQVLANILGGGMASRLFTEIREKRGLVYSIYASSDAFTDGGSMSFYAGTGQEQIAELVPVLCDELNKVRLSVTADEVSRAKRQIKSSLAMSMETTMRRADRMSRQILRFGRTIPSHETMAKLDAVTVDQVTAVAEKIFSGPAAVAAVGKLDKLEGVAAIQARLV
jgi:predicted Zn-dependent peptidase